MAGTIYLSDREFAVIMQMWDQVTTSCHAADDEYNQAADEWSESVLSIQQKFKEASIMTEARAIAKKMIKQQNK